MYLDQFDQYENKRTLGGLHLTHDGKVRHGVYENADGMVRVYQFPGVTALFFIREGVETVRRWNRLWERKTVSRLAREFLEEMTNERDR